MLWMTRTDAVAWREISLVLMNGIGGAMNINKNIWR
jgi:hypothetical protein